MSSVELLPHLGDSNEIAKTCFMNLITVGSKVKCTDAEGDLKFPEWFERKKFEKGRSYFYSNRIGILRSNLLGLITLIAEPKGLLTLMMTRESTTVEGARLRYISTIKHVMTWYKGDRSRGSRFLNSVKSVRHFHYVSSKKASDFGLGFISQMELSVTVFGFMGFALVRPEVLGIDRSNTAGRQGFVHFWAVICYLLGIEDRFNICLLPFDAVIVICQMIQRYLLVPVIQLETPEFVHMTKILLTGLRTILPYLDFDAELFLVRQMIIIPGYQYRVDRKKEMFCESILTENDVRLCNEALSSQLGPHAMIFYHIPIIKFEYVACTDISFHENKIENITIENIDSSDTDVQDTETAVDDTKSWLKSVQKLMRSSKKECALVTLELIPYDDRWLEHLNDSKYNELPAPAKHRVCWLTMFSKLYSFWLIRYFVETILSIYFRFT